MPRLRYDSDDLGLLQPVRHPLDTKLAALSRRFARMSESKRAAMRSAIRMGEFYTLLEFARRAAVFAVRERRAARVVDGLTAVTMIEAERVDWRDILVAVGLLHHAAGRVGLDGDQLLRDVSPLAEPGTAALLDDIRTRPRREKTLDAWGYQEVETEGGIGFVDGEFRQTRSKYNLLAIATEIAAVLRADRYRPSIEAGEAMPAVWLESGRNYATVEKALRAVREAVSIDADLRRTRGVPADSQHCVVFLHEMRSKAAARQLLDIARRRRPRPGRDSVCKVELAEGHLFCLMIARSWRSGVRSYETPDSLARFAGPLADILRRYVRG